MPNDVLATDLGLLGGLAPGDVEPDPESTGEGDVSLVALSLDG